MAKVRKEKVIVCTDVRECAGVILEQMKTHQSINGLRYPESLRKNARALLLHEGKIRYDFQRGHHVTVDTPKIGAANNG